MARILIVDDSLATRFNLKQILCENDFEIAGEAANGEEAVKKFVELKPDLVTMDITMPVMDGITACRKIKEIAPNACIVMITALGQQTKVLEAIKAGASNYILKPFNSEKTASVLNAVLEKKLTIKEAVLIESR
ncbi:response regulator [Dehalobacter sp. DCM]|uniref:response regulator n=1 Tax=Dehalobacter sp. DCM TaxID=2907827 RepID=UPI003082071C|nr:response regulator [Dehalobacter sp. DCM]